MKFIVAALLLPLLAAAVPARVEASGFTDRLYPYAGVVVRFEATEHDSPDTKTLLQAGAAFSLGKLAPGANVKFNTGHAELELTLRYSFR